MANLRGGGEYGKAWHEAGRLAQQAERLRRLLRVRAVAGLVGLARAGTASRSSGGSNGGLLVGACLTQHPELFGAAVGRCRRDGHAPVPPVHDRLGLDRRLGSPDDPEAVPVAARVLAAAQRPARHALPGDARCSPATTTTGSCPATRSSSRPPLQAAQAGEEPILIRVDTASGPRGRQANSQEDRGRHRRADVPGRGTPGDLIALFPGRQGPASHGKRALKRVLTGCSGGPRDSPRRQ